MVAGVLQGRRPGPGASRRVITPSLPFDHRLGVRPDDTLAAGAAFASDGSIVNNVLGYPGIFRGALLAGAEDINLDMKLAAARAIADLAEQSELVPDALDPKVHEHVADAVKRRRSAAVPRGRTWLLRVCSEPVGGGGGGRLSL